MGRSWCLLVAGALVLAACGGNGDDSARGGAGTAVVSSTTGAVTAAPSTISTSTTSTTSTPSAMSTPSTTVAPTATSPPPTLEKLLARGRLNIAHAGGELEGPDETIFTFRQALANAGIPAHTLCVAFIFPDYHNVGDHWEKIDYANLAKVNRMIALALLTLANNAARA